MLQKQIEKPQRKVDFYSLKSKYIDFQAKCTSLMQISDFFE